MSTSRLALAQHRRVEGELLVKRAALQGDFARLQLQMATLIADAAEDGRFIEDADETTESEQATLLLLLESIDALSIELAQLETRIEQHHKQGH